MRFLLVISVLVYVASAGEYDYTVEIRAGKYECYFQPVTSEKHKNIELFYQVIDGGDLNINAMVIYGADVLIQERMQTDGTHKIPIKGLGDYQICFDNSFSYQARKVVYFEVYLTDAEGHMDELDLKSYDKNDADFAERMRAAGIAVSEFHAAADRIRNTLNIAEFHQATLRGYEHRDKAIMSANLSRVSFWSILTTLVLLGVSFVQVYTIRSLFEENSKLGRALRR